MTKHPAPIHKILIVQTAFIGDVVLTLPLIQQTASLFPESDVHVLTIPTSVPLVETHRDVRRVWVFKKRTEHRGVKALWRFARQLKNEQFDLALVPHRSLRSALLVWLADIPRRVGFDKSAGRWLFTDVIPYPTGVHEIERNLQLLRPFWEWNGERILPNIFFTEQDHDNVQRWLHQMNLQDQEFIALAPGSIWATKRWLPERFARLADQLIARGWPVVLIGGPEDNALAERICSLAQHPIVNAAGEFSVRESALLLKHARLLVSNDSAPMHLAVAVRTPVVAIFGPTVPAFGFYPYGENDRVVEDTQLSCRPCGIHGHQECPLGTHACMQHITVEMVLNAVEEMIHAEAERR